MPLPRGPSRPPDFEVTVTFLTADEGGRKTAAHQGYRPDMGFGDASDIWMIWPEFLREDGSRYLDNEHVPRSVHGGVI